MGFYTLTEAVASEFAKRKEELEKLSGQKDLKLELDSTKIYWVLKSPVYRIACFGLGQMHGCCAIVTSFHVEVSLSFQQRGIGKILLDLRMAATKAAGYTQMTATTVSYNEPECKLLERAGWRVTREFKSRRTGNDIKFWMKDLYEGE